MLTSAVKAAREMLAWWLVTSNRSHAQCQQDFMRKDRCSSSTAQCRLAFEETRPPEVHRDIYKTENSIRLERNQSRRYVLYAIAQTYYFLRTLGLREYEYVADMYKQ
jgi:hypothetical protein